MLSKMPSGNDMEDTSAGLGSKGCEGDCNFPSECRWRPRLTANMRQESAAELVSPTSPNSPGEYMTLPSRPSPPSPRDQGSYLDKILDSVERRMSQPSTGIDLPPDNPNAKYEYPVLDFATFKAGMDKVHGIACDILPLSPKSAGSPPVHFDAQSNLSPKHAPGTDMMDVDIDKTMSAVLDAQGKTLISQPRGTSLDPVVEMEEPPVSPRRGAWDWSIGGIGTVGVWSEGAMDLDS